MIKHVSFDVWGTLISANPEYAKARAQYLSRVLDVDLETVTAAYRKTKRCVDDQAAISGAAWSTDQVFAQLYAELNVDIQSHEHRIIRSGVENLFHAHPPTITDGCKAIIGLLGDKNITVSIGSNSNFIAGDVMYPFLQKQFNGAFKFGVFSDQEHCAKPHSDFFDQIFERAWQRVNFDIWRDSILHVGDNYVCDVIGARNARMKSLLLDSVNDIQPAFRHLTDFLS